jgi:hypothetical protein
MNKQQKLERWAKKEIKRTINFLIIPDDSNGFIAFGKYHIQPLNGLYQVNLMDREMHTFVNKRSAISWCVAHHNKKTRLANTILTLDRKKQLLNNDIQYSRIVCDRSKNVDFKETVTIKMQPKIDALTQLNVELEKCINSAKYLQIKGFPNETPRTSRA